MDKNTYIENHGIINYLDTLNVSFNEKKQLYFKLRVQEHNIKYIRSIQANNLSDDYYIYTSSCNTYNMIVSPVFRDISLDTTTGILTLIDICYPHSHFTQKERLDIYLQSVFTEKGRKREEAYIKELKHIEKYPLHNENYSQKYIELTTGYIKMNELFNLI